MFDEQRGNERDAPDVDVAIFAAESEAFRKMRADFVAVEHFDTATACGSARVRAVSAIVLFPAPERPVSHTVNPWFKWSSFLGDFFAGRPLQEAGTSRGASAGRSLRLGIIDSRHH